MSPSTSPSTFIFSDIFDTQQLFSLYENDFQWIEEIFGTALNHFDGDVEAIDLAYKAGDSVQLKKAIHKIKPGFGFVGLPGIQELCKTIEDKIGLVDDIRKMEPDIKHLLSECSRCKSAIAADLNRLIAFNKSIE